MITVRAAKLEDCEQIASLAQAGITTWQRWDAGGRVEDVPYSLLTIYERWLHGGPWMSLETAAIHLGRLLLGAGTGLVAEDDGALVGYAEAYLSAEPEPFGLHLHLGRLYVHADGDLLAIGSALLAALRQQAKASKCVRLTTTPTAGEPGLLVFDHHGASPLVRLRRYSLPARTGQGLYQSVADATTDAKQIAGWVMPIGRTSSARQEWENLWQPTWDVLPEVKARTQRLRFAVSGQDAFVVFQCGLYNPRAVEVSCWSPRGLNSALLMALRDWAYRENYRTLTLLVTEATVNTLGGDAEADGYLHDVLALGV